MYRRLVRAAVILCACIMPFTLVAEEGQREIRLGCKTVGVELQICQEAVRLWSEKTGHPASVVSMPASTTESLALYQQFFSAKDSSIDVFMIDIVWPGILKTHLADLRPHIPQEEIDRHFDSITENNTIDGKLVAMPFYTDVGILYYRKDLLDKYDLPVPATWEGLEQTAKVILKAEHSEGNNQLAGYVWQGKAYEGLTCNAMEWISSSGGGTIVADTGRISLVNDKAIAAVDRAAGWIGTISPRGVLNYSEEEARGIFQSGKAVFMRNWPYAWVLTQSADSPVKDKVGVAMLPSAGEGYAHSGTLGGWQVALSRYSTQPEKAAELVRFMSGPEVQRLLAVRGSYNPTIKTLYNDQDILKHLPASDIVYEALSQAEARPSRIAGMRYNQLSNGFWNAVHATLAGHGGAEENFSALEKRLERISKEGTWQ